MRPDWTIFKGIGNQCSYTSVAQIRGNCLGYFENITLEFEASLRATFGNLYATIYSIILSHWLPVTIKTFLKVFLTNWPSPASF